MILNLNSQIIWVFVDLLILFVLMKKFLFGPITQMLDDRAQQVSDTLDQADKRLAEAEQQQTAHAAQLASAKQEAAQIIEDARARGQQEYDRLVAEAQTAVQRLDEQAARRRDSERTQMLREAKKEITALVLLTTAKVSRQKLNSDTDRAMIDDFLRKKRRPHDELDRRTVCRCTAPYRLHAERSAAHCRLSDRLCAVMGCTVLSCRFRAGEKGCAVPPARF
ncbi:MAG: F0F1 ATP synthase subunit B [Butyricicoccus sp.]